MRLQVTDGCVLFSKPEELIEWLDNYDILLNLTNKEAGILLSYMETHGYGIGAKGEELVRVDKSNFDLLSEPFSIDDVIDTVFEWNYELKLEADNARRNPMDFKDFCEKQSLYEQLANEEKAIEKMFDRTVYGRKINDDYKRVAIAR